MLTRKGVFGRTEATWGELSRRTALECQYEMDFEWDPNKNRANQAKHRVSFETAARVFEDPWAVSIPDQAIGEELRWKTIGNAEGFSPLLLVVHTVRSRGAEETVRIISARWATRGERRDYEEGRN